ncbi:hypothetical protein BVI434_2190002 [Burkholderia vietnamiensis]|nr:hypothetical protein BVI434_2190002 [Burkholderia vietnamiensis]
MPGAPPGRPRAARHVPHAAVAAERDDDRHITVSSSTLPAHARNVSPSPFPGNIAASFPMRRSRRCAS